MDRKIVLFLIALAISSAILARAADVNRGTISGVVKDKSGAPVAGATVKLRNGDRGFTVAVISQDQGRYRAENLLPGVYTVHAMGGGFQSDAKRTVDVKAGQDQTAELSLGAPADFWQAMTMSHFAELMPEDDAKSFVVTQCSDCHPHGPGQLFISRKTRADWIKTADLMKNHPYGYFRSLDISAPEIDRVMDYVSKYFTPQNPPFNPEALVPKTLITGPASKVIATEFELPGGASPHDVAVDSKGIAWVSEDGTGVIGRFDPNTLTYTRIPAPGPKSYGVRPGSAALETMKRGCPCAVAIAVDPQDRVWFSEGRTGALVQYDPKTQAFTSYALPKPPRGASAINTIRFHPNGTVWGTGLGSNRIYRLDPATKQVSEFLVPSGVAAGVSAGPYGMAIDNSQMVWFFERSMDKVGVTEPRTGEIAEVSLPTKGAYLRRGQADAQGNIWFGEYGGVGQLATVDSRTKKVAEYPTPTKYSGAYSVDVDKKSNLIYVNEMMGDKIARFDPRTKTFVEYNIPTHFSSIRRIEVDPSKPTRIWYAGYNVDTVGYLDVIP